MEKTQLQVLTEQAAEGDRESENELISFFLPRALNLARRKIKGLDQNVSDAEDLANSAIRSLCMRIRDGRIVFYNDHQLMGVVRKIIANKASKVWRYHLAEKRNVNRIEGRSSNINPKDIFARAGIDPTDIYLNDGDIDIGQTDFESVVNILDSLETELHGMFKGLLESLEPYPRKVLILLLENDYSNEELAAKLGRSMNSIARYRNSIREGLKEMMS